MNFKTRSYQKELLDEAHIPFLAIKHNMEELEIINTWLGGHNITLKGFKALLENRSKITICEIGCGGGDNLLAIVKWCRKKNVEVNCVGIDMKEACIQVAQSRSLLQNISKWVVSDYALVSFDVKPDIVFSSLFCHHFTEVELVQQLRWMQANCTLGFFINDLHRHWLAYYSIKWLTKIFSKSYLVKNDAPLSVARGFLLSEWKALGKTAQIVGPQVEWKWAFRHLIICKHAG